MDYGEVLGNAWKTIWKHKILWLFGLFASCSRSGGGGGSSGGNTNYSGNGNSGFFPAGSDSTFIDKIESLYDQAEVFFDNIQYSIADTPVWAWISITAAVLLLICLIALIQHAIGTFGRIGLVRGVWQADEGAERLTFNELFKGSLPYFWRIFLMYLVVGIAIFLLIIIALLLGTAIGALTLGIGLICIIPLALAFLCLSLPLSWFIGVMLDLSTVAIVGEDLDVLSGIRYSWEMFKKDPGPVLLMGLILGVGNFILSILMALPFIVVAIPFIIGMAVGGFSGDWNIGVTEGAIISGVCCCMYMPVLLLLTSVLEAYLKSAWTLTFRRLKDKPL